MDLLAVEALDVRDDLDLEQLDLLDLEAGASTMRADRWFHGQCLTSSIVSARGFVQESSIFSSWPQFTQT